MKMVKVSVPTIEPDEIRKRRHKRPRDEDWTEKGEKGRPGEVEFLLCTLYPLRKVSVPVLLSWWGPSSETVAWVR